MILKRIGKNRVKTINYIMNNGEDFTVHVPDPPNYYSGEPVERKNASEALWKYKFSYLTCEYNEDIIRAVNSGLYIPDENEKVLCTVNVHSRHWYRFKVDPKIIAQSGLIK